MKGDHLSSLISHPSSLIPHLSSKYAFVSSRLDSSHTVAELLTLTDRGLYSPQGDFYIDPWLPVPRAIITHAHVDHARPGSLEYLTAAPGAEILRERLGGDAIIQSQPYREPFIS